MFNVVVDRRKRRVWSARTVAASVGAHLLVLAGVIAAASSTQAAPAPQVVDIWTAPPPRPPEPAQPKPPPPADQPVPVKGTTLQLRTPETVPTTIAPPNPNDVPVSAEEFSGKGPIGNVIGPPDTTARTPTVIPDPPLRDWRTDEPIDASKADQLPELLSPRDAQRMLERVYPSMLRDAGVTGRTTVLLVIDKDGAVQPGSITVQETSHDQFRDAAIRAAQRFRFRPAKLHGEAIAVSISIPIEWQIQP
jgi:periplasmic protein TonB